MVKNFPLDRLRIAMQKSGRLSEDSFNLLKRCGIKINQKRDQLFCHSENFPLDILLVRDDDIPGLVHDGICDLGIVGTNVLEEKLLQNQKMQDHQVQQVLDLNFGKCHLAIAIPEKFTYVNLESLQKLRIATSHPFLLEDFLRKRKIHAEVIELSGAVEIAPRLGIADAICDLVSTGTTLEANNLREVEIVFRSNAVLIQKPNALEPMKQVLYLRLQQRLTGVLQANEIKYIMLHAPKDALTEIVNLLPGSEHPTIMSLQSDPNKVALHAVCRESVFWETMEKLKAAGASSILVLPVEKMLC